MQKNFPLINLETLTERGKKKTTQKVDRKEMSD